MSNDNKAAPADEREAFEAWLSHELFKEGMDSDYLPGYFSKSSSGNYHATRAQDGWAAWQARAAHARAQGAAAAPQGQQEAVRPLGYIHKTDVARLQDEITWDGTYLTIGIDHWAQWQEDTPYDHLQPIYTTPQPAPAVGALVEALTICVGSIREICHERNVPLPNSTLNRADAALSAFRGEGGE